ncbi:hypothetical protein ACF1BN_08180 [Streptomyces sp. NPDC014861]
MRTGPRLRNGLPPRTGPLPGEDRHTAVVVAVGGPDAGGGVVHPMEKP